MLAEFRKFILRGSVLDLAIGVIVGGAFGKIITSLVNDIIMPPISLLLGQLPFPDLYIVLKGDVPAGTTLAAAKELGAVTLNYGAFVSVIVDFLIVAFVIFLVIKGINRLYTKPAPAPGAPTTKDCPHCFTTIPSQATRCPHCTSELS